MQKSLNQSVADVSSGLPQQFENLAFPLMDSLYGTALKMTRDQLDAEDLTQTTYLKAYRFFHRFEPGTNFNAWMFRILMNNFNTEYRIKKRMPERVDFETTCATFPKEEASEFDGNRGIGFTENYEELFDDTITAALDRLPEEYRVIIILCDVCSLKYKEIAEALDCPQGTVMSRLSRGRKMLARSLKKYAATNGFMKQGLLNTNLTASGKSSYQLMSE